MRRSAVGNPPLRGEPLAVQNLAPHPGTSQGCSSISHPWYEGVRLPGRNYSAGRRFDCCCDACVAQSGPQPSRLTIRSAVHTVTKTFKPYTKAEIIASLQKLPEDATVDDAMEVLALLARVEIADAEHDAGPTIPHEEVMREMAEWQD